MTEYNATQNTTIFSINYRVLYVFLNVNLHICSKFITGLPKLKDLLNIVITYSYSYVNVFMSKLCYQLR